MEKEILISEDKLKNVILENKEYIGLNKGEGLDRLIAGVGFIITVVVAVFKFEWIKYVFEVIGAIYVVIGGKTFIKSFVNPYTHHDLIKDIKSLDQIEHRHSIVAIKNTWDDFPNRFLIYHDKKWDCDFFLNYKTVENMEDVIKEKVSSQLRIKKECIHVEFKGNDISRKYSWRDKKDKTYNHDFYLVIIDSFPEEEKSLSFSIDQVDYKWLTIEEMRNNQNTYRKNADVINKVDELM